MTHILFTALLLSEVPAYAAQTAKQITIERIFQSPELDGSLPLGVKFSPNGKRLTFLQPKKDDYEVLDLWELDLKTGKPQLLVDSKSLKFGPLSEAEKARRERMRISRQGIVDYHWSEGGHEIVFPAGNDLYVHLKGQSLHRLTNNEAGEVDVRFSKTDRFVSYVRDQNLYVFDLKENIERAVTTAGKDTLSYGTAEFIAQEEMGRYSGYWWSEDDAYLALTEVDESPVKLVERYEINADSVTTLKQRYPEAGTANAKVRLGWLKVSDLEAGKPQIHWLDFGKNKDLYLPRVAWTKDGKLAYQLQPRDQRALEMFLFDPASGKTTKILTEKNKHWINLHDDWHWLRNSPNFIWGSEKSGFHHLYLLDRSGKEVRALTKGQWNVDGLEAVDEEGGWVYFTAWMHSPTERHLYRVPLYKDAQPQQLTTGTWNRIRMDRNGKFYVRYFSSPQAPSQVTVHSGDGKQIAVLSNNEVNAQHPLYPYKDTLSVPEYGSFKGPSGELIYYSLQKPKNFDPKKKYPLLVSGYGGPGNQLVTQSWQGRWGLFASVLTQDGFVVATFDNRGSARRGRKFEDALDRAFGTVEVEDQKAGVEFLVRQGFIDPKRVGFVGWSYGGYLAMMLLSKAPQTFQAVAAIAPVSDFALYDTHYTERYLGKPQENKKAYDRANVLNYVKNIQGRALIIHGMADDNVLFTNSTMLFKKLTDEGKLYESVTYPGAKHGISGKINQTHVFRTIQDFFKRTLL